MLKTPSWLTEFRAFIMRGSAVDLAVGMIVGAAFSGVVNSLVKDVINPVLGLLVGGMNFSDIFFTLNGEHYANLVNAQHAGAPTLNLGLFANALISFTIIGFTIFWAMKVLTRLRLHEDAGPAGTTRTDILLEEIRDILKDRPQAQPSPV